MRPLPALVRSSRLISAGGVAADNEFPGPAGDGSAARGLTTVGDGASAVLAVSVTVVCDGGNRLESRSTATHTTSAVAIAAIGTAHFAIVLRHHGRSSSAGAVLAIDARSA